MLFLIDELALTYHEKLSYGGCSYACQKLFVMSYHIISWVTYGVYYLDYDVDDACILSFFLTCVGSKCRDH